VIKTSLIILMLVGYTIAQNSWIIKGGLNLSSFSDSDNEKITGYSLGIERNITINDFIIVCPEFLVSSQGGMIRNTPVWNDDIDQYLDAYDIEARMQLYEFSFFIKFPVIVKNDLNITFNIGPSYRIGLHDESRLFNRHNLYDSWDIPEEYKNLDYNDFKYRIGEHVLLNTNGWAINTGFSIYFKKFLFEIQYSYSFHSIGHVDVLMWINKKYHALHFLAGLNL